MLTPLDCVFCVVVAVATIACNVSLVSALTRAARSAMWPAVVLLELASTVSVAACFVVPWPWKNLSDSVAGPLNLSVVLLALVLPRVAVVAVGRGVVLPDVTRRRTYLAALASALVWIVGAWTIFVGLLFYSWAWDR